MKIAVIGGGSWGTTLANLLAKKKYDVHLWVREKELLAEIKSKNENPWFLPGVPLSPNLKAGTDLRAVTKDAEGYLMAIPSQYVRPVYVKLREYLPGKPIILCASKGIELDTMMTMSQVVDDVLGSLKPRYAVLSGPSFAFEVSREMPTAVTLGCENKKLGRRIQEIMSTDYFRVYYNKDFRGVELGGAVKNIIAIAAGISDGLGFGTNARAALITRGLAEMSRLGKAMGADPKTFMGLSGMGDLVLTCTGELSRNRRVGLKIGQGEKLMDILSDMKMVAEGVKTTESVYKLSKKLKVDMPITEQVYAALYQGKDARTAVVELMRRELKEE